MLQTNGILILLAIFLGGELVRRRLSLPFRWQGIALLLALALLCLSYYAVRISLVHSRDQSIARSNLAGHGRAADLLAEGMQIQARDGMVLLNGSQTPIDVFSLFGTGRSFSADHAPIRTPFCSWGVSRRLFVDVSSATIPHDSHKGLKSHSPAYHVLLAIASDLSDGDSGWKITCFRGSSPLYQEVIGDTYHNKLPASALATLGHDCGAVLSFACIPTAKSNVYEVLSQYVVRSTPDALQTYGSQYQ